MNDYIFYTLEGYTGAPNESVVVDNCQVLGCASGSNAEEALQNLMLENTWIAEAGFETREIIVKQLLTEEQLADIADLLDFFSSTYHQIGNENTHIIDVINRLKSL